MHEALGPNLHACNLSTWNKEFKVILAYVELGASLGYRRPSLNKQTHKSKTKCNKVKSYFQNSLFYG